MHTRFLYLNLTGRGHVVDLGMNGKITGCGAASAFYPICTGALYLVVK
jgi:hypothetical protein